MKKSYKIEVDCANCANLMEEATRKTVGVANATVNFMTQKMIVEFAEGADAKRVMPGCAQGLQEGRAGLRNRTGLSLNVFQRLVSDGMRRQFFRKTLNSCLIEGDWIMNKKQKKMLTRILIAAAMLIALKLIPVTGILQLALYLVVYGIIGYDILKKAWKGILNRSGV